MALVPQLPKELLATDSASTSSRLIGKIGFCMVSMQPVRVSVIDCQGE